MGFSIILGYIGIGLWFLTNFLRTTNIVNNDVIAFILGIMPNIGAAIGIAMLVEGFIIRKGVKIKPFKLLVGVIAFIFVGALGSEIVHDLFINSPFDINDMIATSITLGIYGLIRINEIKKNNNEVLVDKN